MTGPAAQDGPLMFVRYAYPPNALGYCGPDDFAAFREYAVAGVVDQGLVKLAQAQGTELENQALRGVGSENMVGLRMAEALRNTQVIVLPTDGDGGTNPLDLRAMLRRFDVKGE